MFAAFIEPSQDIDQPKNAIIRVTPIREAPPRVLYELWHDQPFAPCVEPISEELSHADNRS